MPQPPSGPPPFGSGASPYGPPPVSPYAQPYRPIIVVAPGGSLGTPAGAATFVGMRLLFGLIPAIIALGIGGFTAYTATRATGGTKIAGGLTGFGGWNGSGPLLCGGNDTFEASGITSRLGSGPVINVAGNCHFTCRNCTLEAPDVVIAAGGNGEIDLVDCKVNGAQAVVAGGNANVRVTGTSMVTGKVVQGGNASVTIPPGALPAAPKPPPVSTPPTPPTPRSGPSPSVPGHGPSKPH